MKYKFSTVGMIIGAAALLLGLVHFTLGPFSSSPPPADFEPEQSFTLGGLTLGISVSEEATPAETTSNLDQIIGSVVMLLGGIAVILGVIGYARNDPFRVAGGAAFLGATAIALQLFIFALGVLIVAIVLAVIVSQLGIG